MTTEFQSRLKLAIEAVRNLYENEGCSDSKNFDNAMGFLMDIEHYIEQEQRKAFEAGRNIVNKAYPEIKVCPRFNTFEDWKAAEK